jgi:hypothetical protein
VKSWSVAGILLQSRRVVAFVASKTGGPPVPPLVFQVLCRDESGIVLAHADRFEG